MIALNLEEVIISNRGLIRTMANRMRIDPDDLEQEISLQAIKSKGLAKYDPEKQKISSFVGLIAKRTAIGMARKEATREMRLHRPYTHNLPKTEPTPDSQYERNEEKELMDLAIEALGRDQNYPHLAMDRAKGVSYGQLTERYKIHKGLINGKIKRQIKDIRKTMANTSSS